MNISLNGHRDVGQTPFRGIANSKESSKRILITNLGSCGDLHPYLAIGLRLQAYGHNVTVGTTESHRNKIEKVGLSFAPIGPDMCDPDLINRFRRWGLAWLMRELMLPALPQTYEETLAAAAGADILLAGQANFASQLVAETLKIPWISALHFPLGLMSAYDPPVLPVFPALTKNLRRLGPSFWKPAKYLIGLEVKSFARKWYDFRKQIGLANQPGIGRPDWWSPLLHLALFSPSLAPKQRDWPPQTIVTGFPWYDQDGDAKLPEDLIRFLNDGPPPIIFTLGSAISKVPAERAFYEESAKAAKLLGYRAVLLYNQAYNRPQRLSTDVIAFDYVPLRPLLQKAAAVVHHGGIGSTGLAMRTGLPMLAVPCAWDQPDNAARVTRLGIARTVPRHRYTADRAAAELYRLLNDRTYTDRAAAIGRQVSQEDGAQIACEVLSKALRMPPGPREDDGPQNRVIDALCLGEEAREVANR